MSYNSKYTGAEIEVMLDKVANGELVEKNEYNDTIAEIWGDKQENIADLEEIRAGAALGATALQRIDYPQLEDNLIDSGFYHSPDGMLYRSDMEDAVLESLNKADSALQSENDPIFSASPAASITAEKMQEWDAKQDLIADIDTIRSGANKGGTSEQTANKTTALSSSSTDSQYPSAKAVYDALQNVGGGGGSANRPIVKHGNADTIFTLTPNTVHQWEHVAALSLTIPQDDSYELEFFVLVEPNSSDFILTMSSNMQWANGDIPAFEANKQYEINIRGNRASYNVYGAPSPSGTYISYVENNGSDYILTDIIIDNNIVGLEAKVVPLFNKPSESSTYYSLMGTRKTSSTADTSIGIYFMSSGVIPYWSGAKKSSVGSIVNGEMLTIDIDYGAIAVNNTNPLAIFGLNTAGSVERIGKFRIYSLAFNDAAGEKVFELKPYKRIDGAYGLYDTISGKFYTSVKNQLTGA